jgi:hypothetical protein
VTPQRAAGWLLLIHQIPPKPNYFRVKVGRRLQRLGAVAIKNSVYVLPQSEQAQEDFQWVLREITEGGGDGSVCEARFVDGLSNGEIEALFHAARDADYAAIAEEARALAKRLPEGVSLSAPRLAKATAEVAGLRRWFGEVVAIDFFGAPGREGAEGLINGWEARMHNLSGRERSVSKAKAAPGALQQRTWVTRTGVHVDRMACAWLIRRFIDPAARFKFVAPKTYKPKKGELRFDMFEAEFTHQGDHCTFEVLIERTALRDPALRPIAEIIHDIDLKDGKFRRPETPGVDRLIAGIAMGNRDDEARVNAAATVWDGLYEYFKRKRGAQ